MLSHGHNLQGQVDDFNCVIRYLAQRDLPDLTAEALLARYHVRQADLLILLGGITTPDFAELVARAYQGGLAKQLMLVGGQGHSTQNLRAGLAAHPRYGAIPTADRTEADMLYDVLVGHFGLDRDHILLERESTNCGNNATYALQVVRLRRCIPEFAILVMDPIMQRRIGESFRHAWREERTAFVCQAPAIPLLAEKEGALAFADPAHEAYYRMDSFLKLVMGELPRLRDDEQGYGPRGHGFIGHVDIPEEVEQAFARLLEPFGQLVRAANPVHASPKR